MFTQAIKDVLRDIDNREINDLILAKADLVSLNIGYEDGMMDVPEWVVDGINSLIREITNRSSATLEKELKTLEAKQLADSSREERKDRRGEQIAALKKKLGKE